MKQLFCVVIALVIAVSFAACTSSNNDTTTIATTTTSLQTTTSTQGSVTTTIDNTVTTTTQQEQSTTENSDTTTNVVTTTATTIPTTESSGDIAYYSEYPEVPDYGAMVGVNYTKFKSGTFYYDATLVAQADPQNESASSYMQLLQDCGYTALSPYDKNGVQGYVYGNPDTGIVVLFGAAREQGAIVVAISQQ